MRNNQLLLIQEQLNQLGDFKTAITEYMEQYTRKDEQKITANLILDSKWDDNTGIFDSDPKSVSWGAYLKNTVSGNTTQGQLFNRFQGLYQQLNIIDEVKESTREILNKARRGPPDDEKRVGGLNTGIISGGFDFIKKNFNIILVIAIIAVLLIIFYTYFYDGFYQTGYNHDYGQNYDDCGCDSNYTCDYHYQNHFLIK